MNPYRTYFICAAIVAELLSGCRYHETEQQVTEDCAAMCVEDQECLDNCIAENIGSDGDIDDTPKTFISAGPPRFTVSNYAKFVFNCTTGDCGFGCSLDGSEFEKCTSPYTCLGGTVRDCSPGNHVLRISSIDQFGQKETSSVGWTWTILEPKALIITHTDQASCLDDTQEMTCPQPNADYYGQDSQNVSSKTDYDVLGDGTVRDLVTGLMWQQQDDGELRTRDEANEYCSSLELAGYRDWYLPHVVQSHSIVNYDGRSPAIDEVVFSGTQKSIYWSFPDYIDFTNGEFLSGPSPWPVRCVRDDYQRYNKESETECNTIDNADGTFTAPCQELIWQQENEEVGNTGDGVRRNWKDALKYCADLSLGGENDWRLPSVKELFLVSKSKLGELFSLTVSSEYDFTKTLGEPFWTSTTYPLMPNHAFYVDPSGLYYWEKGIKSSEWFTICVRSAL